MQDFKTILLERINTQKICKAISSKTKSNTVWIKLVANRKPAMAYKCVNTVKSSACLPMLKLNTQHIISYNNANGQVT